IEDAVSATKAAIEEGIVPGGGTALIRAREAVRKAADELLTGDVATGCRLVATALSEPLRWIAQNAGLPGGVLVQEVEAAEGPVGGQGPRPPEEPGAWPRAGRRSRQKHHGRQLRWRRGEAPDRPGQAARLLDGVGAGRDPARAGHGQPEDGRTEGVAGGADVAAAIGRLT